MLISFWSDLHNILPGVLLAEEQELMNTKTKYVMFDNLFPWLD